MMKRGLTKKAVCLFLCIYSLTGIGGVKAFAAPLESTAEVYAKKDVNVSSRIGELIFGKGKQEDQHSLPMLIPGGDVFGIRITEEHPTVIKADKDSAIRKGDKLISINGVSVGDGSGIGDILSMCGGKAVSIELIRGGEKMTVTTVPKKEGDELRLGITLRRATTGIGTVTYIDPETCSYGGLGHGVTDPETGECIDICMGEATGVVLGGLSRGETGKPGELSGILNKKHLGTIERNTTYGVFGKFNRSFFEGRVPIVTASKSEIKTGEAEIISTVKGSGKSNYKIEITEIDKDSTGSKSFKIRIVDPTLIALTGGVIRGMSGSPIIQDGKLVGAVTHVMVANPTEGYGIFIENMLNAAQSEVIPKAA